MNIKDRLDVVQKVLAILGILIAGWWFLIRGEGLPRADVSHSFHTGCISEGIRWVRATITIENVGNVRVHLAESEHRAAQVSPVYPMFADAIESGQSTGNEKGRIDWPELTRSDFDAMADFLEPGETHTQYWDFYVGTNVETIQVTSFYPNSVLSNGSADIGWRRISLYDLEGAQTCN